MSRHKILILGGGISGLTAGYELVRRDYAVTVLEQEEHAGGLFRTMSRDGFRFDLGGHRLYSEKPEIMDYYRDLGQSSIHEVERRSRILLRGRYIDYPLELSNAITAFGTRRAVRIGSSYLRAAIANGRNGKGTGPHGEHTFEDWVVGQFGRALYDLYFKPYTEKVWGLPCREISAQWAASQITVGNLVQALFKSVFRRNTTKTLIDRFLYPDQGVGSLCDELVRRIRDSGLGDVQTGSEVRRIRQTGDGWQVIAGPRGHEKAYDGHDIISTIPVHALVDTLEAGGMGAEDAVGRATRQLAYRDLILIMMPLNKLRVSPDSWTYFPDSDVIFGRSHEPRNWSIKMVPEGKTSLCLETFATRGDEIWQLTDEAIIDRCLESLEALDLTHRSEILNPWVMRVPDAYPIYNIGYKPHLTRLREYMATLPNFHLLGRTGSFKYMNSDLAIELAVAMVHKLASRQRVNAA